jgi:phosphotransferase family enzyme
MDGTPPKFAGPTTRVVRIGQTVRRPAHRNTAAVQALLKHLEDAGFDGAPRALGVDDEGREMVSFIHGTAGHYPLRPFVLTESTLIRLGLLLRRFHDATMGFSLPGSVRWHNSQGHNGQVVCHGDAGPYNTIFRDGAPVAFIDFERAAPGPRIWDIAFVIYRYAPLCDLRERALTQAFLRQIAKRIRILSSAYGFFENNDLFDWIRLRLKTEIHLFEDGENADTARRRKLIEEGHLALYRRDLRLITGVSPVLRGLI